MAPGRRSVRGQLGPDAVEFGRWGRGCGVSSVTSSNSGWTRWGLAGSGGRASVLAPASTTPAGFGGERGTGVRPRAGQHHAGRVWPGAWDRRRHRVGDDGVGIRIRKGWPPGVVLSTCADLRNTLNRIKLAILRGSGGCAAAGRGGMMRGVVGRAPPGLVIGAGVGSLRRRLWL